MKMKQVVAAAGLIAATSLASAAVILNADGTGFVGKGDVQLAFNWNNATLQKNAVDVRFSYSATTIYVATCSWVTGEGTRGEKTHYVPFTVSADVNRLITYDARVRNQITGFTLTGFGATSSVGAPPEVGGSCLGEGADGTWSAVAMESETEALYVIYGASRQVLTITPPDM